MRTAMQEMAKTIQNLQGEVSTLKKNAETAPKTGAPAAVDTTKPGGANQPPVPLNEVVGPSLSMTPNTVTDRQTFLDEQWPAPRANNAPIDPDLKGFMQIPGTNTIFKLGGNIRLDAIYDFGNNGNPNAFIP